MSKKRPWESDVKGTIGESDPGPIRLTKDNCEGCGHPAVLGFVRFFPIQGYGEFVLSCPTPRFFRKAKGSYSSYRFDATGDMVEPTFPQEWPPYPCGPRFERVGVGSGESSAYILGASDKECSRVQQGGVTCHGLPEGETPPTCEEYVSCANTEGIQNKTRRWGYVEDHEKKIWVPTDPNPIEEIERMTWCFPYGQNLHVKAGLDAVEMVKFDSPAVTGISQSICNTGAYFNFTSDITEALPVGHGGGCSSQQLIRNFSGSDILTDEDTFADAASRAAAAQPNDFCWPWNAYLHPLATRVNSLWDRRRCTNDCLSELAWPGHGNYENTGLYYGQGGDAEQEAVGFGCLRPLWGINGRAEGSQPGAEAAKYRIIVPYDAALPPTQLDVTWQVVGRRNASAIEFTDEQSEGNTTVETYRKTIQVGAVVEGGFAAGGGAMAAPVDSIGPLDSDWNLIGWRIISGTLQASGYRKAESTETRAQYKFSVRGFREEHTGLAEWDVVYYDSDNNEIAQQSLSSPIIGGETAEFSLHAEAVTGGVMAIVTDVTVTIDNKELDRGTDEDEWVLIARIRTGYWGFAELADASSPPAFYPVRMTTYEHEMDGGSGYCANGAMTFSREGPLNPDESISMELIRDGSCGQCGALRLYEIERTREELRRGEFVTLKELDESIQTLPASSDSDAPTHRILRWGRDIFRPVTQRESGRPDWFHPRGANDPLTGPSDPWITTKDQTDDSKTTAIREDVWTLTNTRVCGAIVATTPDPAGTIVSVENKAAVTVNREDGTSMRRVRPGFGVPGLSQDCIDYGTHHGAVATAGSVEDAAARFSLVAEGNDCPFGYDIGSKIHQKSDDTYWELVSLPEACEPLTEEHWKQLRYKATPDQYMHTKQPGVSYFIENIVATKC